MKKTLLTLSVIFAFNWTVQTAMAQTSLLKEANEHFDQFAFPKAIDIYLKVLDKDRNNAQALERIADCYRLTSNTRKAEFYYKRAIKANKEKHQLKLYYAQAVMSNKNYAEALIAFDEYTHFVPHDSRGWNFSDYCRNINDYMRDSSLYSVNRLTINAPESDISPAFYADGIVFESARPKGLIDPKSEWTGESSYDMFFSKENAGKWIDPTPLKGKPESHYDEGPLTFDTQNTVMYFTRNLGKGKAKSRTVRLGIFQAHKIGDEWVNIKELSFNNEGYSVGHPTLSHDGKTLYFASDMPGGTGGKDIYMSRFKNGMWSEPENLGTSVNTEGDEMFPFVHADGTLYFASNGWGGFGGLDIFAAKPFEEDWMVINMGYPINGSRDDFGLILNTDKTIGYLSSNRQGDRSSDDIYKVSIQPAKARQMMANTSPNQQATMMPALQPNNANLAMPSVVAQQVALQPDNTNVPKPDLQVTTQPTKVYKSKMPKIHTETPSVVEPKTIELLAEHAIGQTKKTATPIVTEIAMPQQTLDQAPFNAYKSKALPKDPILAANPQLVLMGIVVNKINKQPLSNAIVCLTDSDTKESTKVVTGENGNFIFRLNCEKKYTLSKLFNDKEEDSKKISTINKCNPEMLHAILTGTPSDRVYRGSANPVAENQAKPPTTRKKSYLDEEDTNDDITPIAPTDVPKTEQPSPNMTTNVDGLMFKIQIGSFNQFRSTAHRFFDGVRREINSGKLKIEHNGELTRYIIGTYNNYEEAEQLRQSLLRKYPDAYVAGYVNGYRIEKPIEEILMQYR